MVSRAVVVGSGSAGHRHAAALRAHDPHMEILVVRRPTSTQPLERFRTLGVEFVPSVESAASTHPHLAVIAGPATLHRRAVDLLAPTGAHMLIEKPVAATLRDARSITETAAQGGSKFLVGYHLRFSDTVRAMRQLLADGVIGQPKGFRFSVGQHLSQWRNGIDPAASVTARQDLGGGVLLELSHELDGLRFLLGEIESLSASLRTDGAPTDGRVDTVADLELDLADGTSGAVHLDMVSAVPFRTWAVTGSDGTLLADLLAGTVTRTADGEAPANDGAASEQILHRSDPGERDRAEERLIAHFLDVAHGRARPSCTVADGLATVQIVDAARRSDDAAGEPVPVPGHSGQPVGR